MALFHFRGNMTHTNYVKVNMANTKKMPAWEVVLNVHNNRLRRPRFFSLHTLATLTRRRNLKKLAKEMLDSGRVATCYCPYAGTIVFYPISLAKIYGNREHTLDEIIAELSKFPFPEIRGFDAEAKSSWSGGSYGLGTFIPAQKGISEPFNKTDYAYANEIIDKLRAAKYIPGIPKYKV